MFGKNSLKALIFNGFKAILVGSGALALVMSLTACGPVDLAKSALTEDAFPPMPAPEVATYVVDLSGSTYPMAQLEALGSGIDGYITGDSLGNPFAETPVAPRGLSIQFVTKNSAQAPRIRLVSSKSGNDLYTYIRSSNLNMDGSKQLWNSLMQARKEIWGSPALEGNNTDCISAVVSMLGRQQLLPDALREPASIICQDAKQTSINKQRLDSFLGNPGIEMGSDVEGAFKLSLNNFVSARAEFPTARRILVIASDLVDQRGLDLPKALSGLDSTATCQLATSRAGNATSDFSDLSVVLVGSKNSKINTKLLDQVQNYWTCYLNQLGITNINQQSDLSGF